MVGKRESADDKPFLAPDGFRSVYVEVGLVAYHHFGKLRDVGVRSVDRADELALAQHRNAVADLHDFVEFVRDDDNALPVLAHIAEHSEKFLRLLRSEHRGRLVKNKNVCPAVKHFYDLDSLLFTDRHIVNFLVKVDLEAVFRGDVAHSLPALSRQPVEFHLPAEFHNRQRRRTQSKTDSACRRVRVAHGLDGSLRVVVVYDVTRLRGFFFKFAGMLTHAETRHFLSEDNVVQSGENVHQLEVLVHHTDLIPVCVPWRTNDNRLPLDEDLPFIREIYAREHIHERGFAAPVFSENGKNLTFVHREIHIFISNDISEVFGDALHLHSDGFCHAGPPCFRSHYGDSLDRAERRALRSVKHYAFSC